MVTPGSSLVSLRTLKEEKLSEKSRLQRALIVLLLLISGNVQPNPGPDVVTSFNTSADFKSRTGLGNVHLNVRSLLTKLDMLLIWADTTDADIMVLSETWLKKYI